MHIPFARLIVAAASSTLVATGLLAPGTAVAAGPPVCTGQSLSVTHTPFDGAAGHDSFVLLYRNVTPSTCTIKGYPGFDALTSGGHVLTHAQRTLAGPAGGATSVGTATVAPGGYASAVVEWADFSTGTGGGCAFSTSVATTAANTFTTIDFPLSVSTCSLQVHPTVAGTTRNTRFAQAQLDWQRGATADSADQGLFWAPAAAALALDGDRYLTEVDQLRELFALPDADQTPAQNAAYHRDIAALDLFFGTPALYN